VLLKLKTE